ncbi:MAG: SDR family oxidoreductase [Bacteroidota bacterium]
MASYDYNGKTVLVTGGGSGIGEALATAFAFNGAVVHILDNNMDAALNVVEKITEAEGRAHGHSCDVSDKAQVGKIIETIAENSSLDVLINNAGIAHVGNLENTSEKDMDKLYEVNIKGVYNCMQAVISKMKAQKSGVILNMASIASSIGIADRFAYSMTKGAVLTMTYSVARDYIDFGIRCNSISPARIHTPFVDGFLAKNYPGKEAGMFAKLSKTQPIGRMGKPKEVADLALYLCSDGAAFVTGTDFPIDGGFIKLKQ